MERFTEKSHLIRVILESLSKGQQRREQLFKTVLQRCGSTAKFRTVFEWLVKEGYIAKQSGKHTAPYIITEDGKRFLTGLRKRELQ